MRTLFYGAVFSAVGIVLLNCGEKPVAQQETTFTRLDSLTDCYLGLQDSMLRAWNIMINDDNQKLKAMHNLLHELMVSNPDKQELLVSYEERLEQLERLRYNQKSMANADVVEEYDFASNSLVTELLSLAESQTEFAYNTTLQKLADEIRAADQRVNNYREDYDAITASYNRFVEKNKESMAEIDQTMKAEKKPLFQMVSEE